MLCVLILYISGGTYSLKSAPNDRFFEKLFMAILFSLRVFARNLHTYMIGHYNRSVRIIDLVSHTTYFVCVNFIYKWRNLQFKVGSEWQIFWRTSWQFYFYSQSFCQKSAERKSSKKYFLYFVLMSGLELEPWLSLKT